MEFYIPETKETVRAETRPIVVITSNAEKELPDAFLRRCIFHYIEFPSRDKMAEIVRVHYPDIEDHLLAAAMECFYELRSVKEMQKKPGTSELLDWLLALTLAGIPAEKLEAGVPFLGVLLKKNQDIEVLAEIREKGYSLKGYAGPQ
jgi:MoxR-like ATPase